MRLRDVLDAVFCRSAVEKGRARAAPRERNVADPASDAVVTQRHSDLTFSISRSSSFVVVVARMRGERGGNGDGMCFARAQISRLEALLVNSATLNLSCDGAGGSITRRITRKGLRVLGEAPGFVVDGDVSADKTGPGNSPTHQAVADGTRANPTTGYETPVRLCFGPRQRPISDQRPRAQLVHARWRGFLLKPIANGGL